MTDHIYALLRHQPMTATLQLENYSSCAALSSFGAPPEVVVSLKSKFAIENDLTQPSTSKNHVFIILISRLFSTAGQTDPEMIQLDFEENLEETEGVSQSVIKY
uniref:(northern house mosquito) hypothetical protein n=1 Tax=Culex pipiens TaxID=7175 RepID=A0A8D8KTA6_CULPI